MTQTLEKAFETAAQLPIEAQEELAQHLLSEIKNLAWDKKMADNPDAFDELAAQALAEDERGETVESGW